MGQKQPGPTGQVRFLQWRSTHSIHLNEVSDTELGSNSDWLGMDKVVQTCTIMADINKDQTSGQDNDNQEISYLLPFDPDYQEAEPKKLITNLPKLNECEFDHNFILH